MFSARDLIAKKRDGEALSREEIIFFVQGVTTGEIPDYQAAAWLMAIYLRGMTPPETAHLTAAMADSGGRIDSASLPQPALDKHSTGGVGDKATLIVVPILAACGVFVGKMSGRGLGHTGGTLDKLEAIPGLRIDLSAAQIVAQTKAVGACLAGQTGELAPADKKLYALRDVTATVGSLPLIVASILSKKLAGGAGAFLFDVKVGDGALMKTLPEATALAQALVSGAEENGRRAVAVLSDMSQPLGRAVGNALEISEARNLLDPAHFQKSDTRLRELCRTLSIQGLRLARNISAESAGEMADNALASGAAMESFRALIEAQGGDLDALPTAPVRLSFAAEKTGWIEAIAARAVGDIVVNLGGGRRTKEDRIDPAVGIVFSVAIGDAVKAGQTLAEIHADDEASALAAAEQLRQVFTLVESLTQPPPLILSGKV